MLLGELSPRVAISICNNVFMWPLELHHSAFPQTIEGTQTSRIPAGLGSVHSPHMGVEGTAGRRYAGTAEDAVGLSVGEHRALPTNGVRFWTAGFLPPWGRHCVPWKVDHAPGWNIMWWLSFFPLAK